MNAEQTSPARVVALFTGSSRQVTIRGAPEVTGFPHEQRKESVKVGEHGLEGDVLGTPRRLGRENHALYLFAAEHYQIHESRLGHSVPPGGFGENVLYEDGPNETSLRIGARMRLGSAEIEAVSPRVPCYKLTHFLWADQGFPAAFSATDRTGFYARVIVPGYVEEGSTLVLIGQNESNATLAELNHALADPYPDPARVSAVLGSPDLLPDLAAMIRERFAKLRPELAQRPVRAQVISHCHIAPDIVRIELAPDSDIPANALPWQAGQFVTIGQYGSGALRCYSLIDGPRSKEEKRTFAIAVRRSEAPEGLSVSRWLESTALPGSELVLYPPAGAFVLPEAPGPVLLVGGGIGMTPILALFRELAWRSHPHSVDLLQVVRTPQDLVFEREIVEALSKLPVGRVTRHVTRDQVVMHRNDALPQPFGGRPDLGAVIAACPAEADVFVCGPPEMICVAEAAHRELGRSPDRFHSEAFEPAIASDVESFEDLPPAEIRITGLGALGEWSAGDGPLLGWIGARLGQTLPAPCRSGLCRSCAAGLRSGRVRYPAGITPPQAGITLLCCARPDGPVELVLP